MKTNMDHGTQIFLQMQAFSHVLFKREKCDKGRHIKKDLLFSFFKRTANMSCTILFFCLCAKGDGVDGFILFFVSL